MWLLSTVYARYVILLVVFKFGTLFILFFLSPQEGSPAVIVLEQLNCLATLASIFDLSILDNKNW